MISQQTTAPLSIPKRRPGADEWAEYRSAKFLRLLPRDAELKETREVELSYLCLVDIEDVSELKGPEGDMSTDIRWHLQRMREEPLSEWEPEEKNCAILVSTNTNLAFNVCSQHFGSEAKAVLLIRDEDPKELEVNGWIPPPTIGKSSPKIAAMILGGGTLQLQPTVLTAKEQPGWNEFSYQMETSLSSS
ncbi:hypothetical protein Aspvir_001172 [Aspergillus viridinutans]|uniref:Uncharacterized protein n=1 Tax=Aspergillus viridinutans TaxID=75553 RepID=A0A9P3BUS8_ASPVI|nr:uncharacterized protein Aspvir_001172 [Aspergillus viridinutans]GIJ99048.1 hypothetical protein Aspvir_001172 [Aspergillus viridinutans]